MQEEGTLPVHSDQDALNLAYGGATRLLVISDAAVDRSWPLFFAGHDVNLIDVVAPDVAANRLDALPAIEAVWVELGDTPAPDMLIARLEFMVAQQGLQLVWIGRDAALEQGYAAFGTAAPILSNPSEAERMTQAALLAPARQFALNDNNGDSDAAQIQRLTEEVNRIARLLSALSRSHGLADYPATSSEFGIAGDRVRAPTDPFAVEPSHGLLGFDEKADLSRAFSAEDVRRLIRIRRLRDQFFPSDIFADPAWDMLLDLMAARLSAASVSVSSLCIAAAVPATTALRWIRTLTDAGLFIRYNDPRDGRRVFIGLSDEAADGMTRYFSTVKAQTGMIG